MKTGSMEHAAESKVCSELHKEGFIVAKPQPDLNGTDLLVFKQMSDSIKFCRVQCKGRDISKNKASIIIPESYVTPGFICFLYLLDSSKSYRLYCFFASDINCGGSPKKMNTI